MFNWLSKQNWKRWLGDAIIAIVILIAAALSTGFFDIFEDVENAAQIAGFVGLGVWFGLPFLFRSIKLPFVDVRYSGVPAPDEPTLGKLLFRLSAPVLVLLIWALLLW